MKQEKKNKRLVAVLLGLIVVTVIVYFTGSGSDQINVDRSLFAYSKPAQIDQVTFETEGQQTNIKFGGSNWIVAEQYKADPQRVKVLFAIIKQVRVRRPAARQLQDSLQQLMDAKGTLVKFYREGEVVHTIEVLGNETSGITYISLPDDQQIYLAEIPGYRSYLAGIFTVDTNGWRDPLVFDINWRNMQSVALRFADNPENNFDIVYEDRAYKITQLTETDTTKLFNVLDDISLLFVNDFLTEKEVVNYKNQLNDTTATIIVEDVGKNTFSLEVFGGVASEDAFVVRIDSTDYGLLARNKLRTALRPKRYFIAEKR